MSHQPSILAPLPASGRFLVLGLAAGSDPRAALARVGELRLAGSVVVGLGHPLLLAARPKGSPIAGLRSFPAIAGPGASYPSTQGALYLFVGGSDAGATLVQTRPLLAQLGDAFVVEEEVLGFKYADGRDLSGYLDGTENPLAEKAFAAAIVSGEGRGLDGGSFVAVQRWVHDLARFEAFEPGVRDAIIGRRRDNNEEIADAPQWAHVKRTAQESFEPAAFMVRRSMPWGSSSGHGLFFVAYVRSLDAFERMLERMAGLEDGIADGLARFTRAVSGGYYWCPPRAGDERPDLSALGL